MSAGEDHLPAPGSAFAVTRRGYDATQVDDYLRHLDAQLRMLAADRDASVEQNGQLTRQVNVAWAETDRLKGQLRRLSAPPESVEGMSERLQSMLRLAQDEVAERRKRAEAEAADIIARAEAAAGELPKRNEATRMQLEQEREQLILERERILGEAQDEADRVTTEANAQAEYVRSTSIAEAGRVTQESEQRRQALDAASAAHRKQIEEDFDIAMSARRAEAMANIHQAQDSSREGANRLISDARNEAERRLRDATEKARATVSEASVRARKTVGDAGAEATAMVTAAERRVADFDSLRDRMVRQLAGLRGVLDQALPTLDPPTLEQQVDTQPEPEDSPGQGPDDPGAPTAEDSTDGLHDTPATHDTPVDDGAVPPSVSGNAAVTHSPAEATEDPHTVAEPPEPSPSAAATSPARQDEPAVPEQEQPKSDSSAESTGDTAPTPRHSPERRPSPTPRRRRPSPVARQH